MGRRPCQPAYPGKVERESGCGSQQGATKRDTRRPSAQEGFMLSDSKSKRLRKNSSSVSCGPPSPVPEGLFSCPVCGEWRGVTAAKEIFSPDHFFEDEDPERALRISCICDGIPCPRCKTNRIYRPISHQWDEHVASDITLILWGKHHAKRVRTKSGSPQESARNEGEKTSPKEHQGRDSHAFVR